MIVVKLCGKKNLPVRRKGGKDFGKIKFNINQKCRFKFCKATKKQFKKFQIIAEILAWLKHNIDKAVEIRKIYKLQEVTKDEISQVLTTHNS